jgi:hypothetical protein
MLEQQQAHGPATVECGQPRILRGQRIGIEQGLHKRQQLPAAFRRQRRIMGGAQQLLSVIPQLVVRIIHQHTHQFQQTHGVSSRFFCRFGGTTLVVILRAVNKSAGLFPLQPLPKVKPQPPRSPKASFAYSRCAVGITKRSS